MKGLVSGVAARLANACAGEDPQATKMLRQHLSTCLSKEPEVLASFCDNLRNKLASDVMICCLLSITSLEVR